MPGLSGAESRPAGLSAAAEGFLADLAARGRAPNTLAAYRRDLAAYERFLAGRRRTAADAGEHDVADYMGAMQAAGRRPASMARALVSLRLLHRWCGSDAAGGVDRPAPAPSDPAVLSAAEVAVLVESSAGTGAVALRDHALLELLYATGARISEVVGLDLGDVGGGLAHLGGRNPRVVPYGEPAAGALARWSGPAGRASMSGPGRVAGAAGPLFVNQRGGRLSRQWGWSVVRTQGERVGLAGRLGPHVLRHSFAVHLAASGAPAGAVTQLLVGQPAVLGLDELVAGYRRWHPRATGPTAPGGSSGHGAGRGMTRVS